MITMRKTHLANAAGHYFYREIGATLAGCFGDPMANPSISSSQ